MHTTDHDITSLIGTIIIGLVSGFVSITRRLVGKKAISKLWVVSECTGVILVTAIAMDVYPVIQPMLVKSMTTAWITQWVFVGVMAHCGSRLMFNLESKFNSQFFK